MASAQGGDSFINFEIDRYLGCPGQAIAYKIGERVWMQARRKPGSAMAAFSIYGNSTPPHLISAQWGWICLRRS